MLGLEKAVDLRRTVARVRQRRFQVRLRRKGTTIGPGCDIARSTRVSARTTFGQGTRVNSYCVFKGNASISLGNYCAIGEAVRMISSNHRTDTANLQESLQLRLGLGSLKESRGPIKIGHNVWIGDCAIVLSGVKIGDGAIIGAGAVVARDVPPFAVVAGTPARVVRMRLSREAIQLLQALEWWNWSEDEMRACIEVFSPQGLASSARS